MIFQYLNGWRAWARYFWMARHKRHGAGRQRWIHAWKGACCARYIVDGQHRGVAPLWLRWSLLLLVLVLSTGSPPAAAATMECRWKSFGVLTCDTLAPPPISKAGFCDVMQRAIGGPFRWAKEDTRATKEQADKINAAGKTLCRWGR